MTEASRLLAYRELELISFKIGRAGQIDRRDLISLHKLAAHFDVVMTNDEDRATQAMIVAFVNVASELLDLDDDDLSEGDEPDA